MLKRNKILPCDYQRIFIESADKKNLYAVLGQSILGAYSFFWLGSLSKEKESKFLSDFAAYLSNYTGPHTVSYFIDQSSKLLQKKVKTVITLPHELSIDHVIACADFFDIKLDAKKISFLKNTFSLRATLSLDQACMIINYLELISAKYLADYIPLLTSTANVVPTLSHLSEFFFTKNSQSFFEAWEKIRADYSDIFWIIFWSEQVWKAYHVTLYLKQKDFVNAKRMSFRLPYSFINRDWQKANPDLLIDAYEFLYNLDYGMKTGSTFCGLDLFYINYFSGKFN